MQTEKNNPTEPARKKTIKEIHAEVKSLPATKMQAVLDILGGKKDQTFYNLMQGRKKASPAEKEAIAKIYDKTVDEIDWQDENKEILIA